MCLGNVFVALADGRKKRRICEACVNDNGKSHTKSYLDGYYGSRVSQPILSSMIVS